MPVLPWLWLPQFALCTHAEGKRRDLLSDPPDTWTLFICFFKLKNLPWTQSLERLISLSEVKWCGMHVTKIPLWKACENLNILKTQMLRWNSSWASYVWWIDQCAKITFPQSSASDSRLVTSFKQESMPQSCTLGKQLYTWSTCQWVTRYISTWKTAGFYKRKNDMVLS